MGTTSTIRHIGNGASRWFAATAVTFSAAAMLLLSACGGSGAAGGLSSNTNTGAAMITLTDAPGDFLSYIVTIDSLKLTRADGTVVETVTNPTPVDFAQLVDLSEIISAQQLPAGSYVSAQLTIDYSNATIVVDNGSGGVTVPVANILDGSGTALSAPVVMTLQLPAGAPLVITRGTVANLALDFNLPATNSLVMPGTQTPISNFTAITSGSQIAVEVSPSLSAALQPDAVKQIHVRGALASVDTSNSTYTINVRPFYNGSGSQGQFVVTTTSTTTYTINGTAYSGSAGLTALQALNTGTLTAAYGSFDVATSTFTASTVLAGTSVAGSGEDSLEGTVTARSGNTLTVGRGLICHANHAGVGFSRTVTVTVGSGTAVTEDQQSGMFTAQDISVGQHLQLFGTYSTDSSGNATLDATAGSARLMLTPLWGQVTANSSNLVTLNLQSLDGQGPQAFNFAGTGTSSASDANPSAYSVNVPASLATTGLGTAPARFLGFVTPFGSAPPDFSAQTLISYANSSAQLQVAWPLPGASAPFASLSASSTSLILTQTTLQSAGWHFLRIGPQVTNVATLSSGITIAADSAAASPRFAIVHASAHSIDTFMSFADLVTALNGDLSGTTDVLVVFANGPFNATTGTLSADQLLIALSD